MLLTVNNEMARNAIDGDGFAKYCVGGRLLIYADNSDLLVSVNGLEFKKRRNAVVLKPANSIIAQDGVAATFKLETADATGYMTGKVASYLDASPNDISVLNTIMRKGEIFSIEQFSISLAQN